MLDVTKKNAIESSFSHKIVIWVLAKNIREVSFVFVAFSWCSDERRPLKVFNKVP